MSPAGRHSYSRRRCGAGSATVERDGQMDGRTVRQTDRRTTDGQNCYIIIVRQYADAR